MVSISNTIFSIFKCITLLIGLGMVSLGLNILTRSDGPGCNKVLVDPLVIVGAAIAAISLLGLIGSCCRVNFALTLYLILMFLLLLCLIGFTVFAFLVTNEGVGKAFSKFRVKKYDNWLRDNLADEKHWYDIKSCSIQSKLCQLNNPTKPSDIQSGCCQPPISCGFVSKNATVWDRPANGPAVKDSSDCTAWSNQQNTLCFNCESCKAAYVVTFKNQWRKLAKANLCLIAFTFIFYSVGCCARSSNRRNKYTKGYA